MPKTPPSSPSAAQLAEHATLMVLCVEHFGTKRALAKALHRSPSTVSQWGHTQLIPEHTVQLLQTWIDTWAAESGAPTPSALDLPATQRRLEGIHTRLGGGHPLWALCVSLVALFDHWTDTSRPSQEPPPTPTPPQEAT
jgi:hypothetical protein